MYVVPIGENAVDIVVRISEGFGFYLTPFSSWWKFPEPFSANHSYAVLQCGGTLASIGGVQLGPSRSRTAFLHSAVLMAEYHKVSVAGGPRKVRWYACGSEYSLERKDASFSSSIPIGAHSARASRWLFTKPS